MSQHSSRPFGTAATGCGERTAQHRTKRIGDVAAIFTRRALIRKDARCMALQVFRKEKP
jgi:hypothetical protein